MKENIIERNARLKVDEKIASFRVKQQLPYEAKVAYAELRAREFRDECARRDLNVHVSVGGLDSITLLLFLRSIGIDCPAVSVSSLEDKSIQRIHKELGVISLRPLKSKVEVIREFGYPILSKEIAGKIALLQNPSEKNKTVRHAIITGETGAYGGNRTGTRMQLSRKWLEKFGGYENETESTNYAVPDFKVSDKCCYYLKEKPCDNWAKEHHSVPYLGLMASEGGRREKALMRNGCNYFGSAAPQSVAATQPQTDGLQPLVAAKATPSRGTIRSAPFAIFSRQDLLQLALELKVPVPEIYGEIVRDEDGTLRTTKAQRTGCSMCGFGIHLEKRPHRFDQLYERNPKEWEFWMFEMGWGHVLDYIGVEWQPQIKMELDL